MSDSSALILSYSEVSGNSLKTERLDTDFMDPCESLPSKVNKSDAKEPCHNSGKVNKSLMPDPMHEDPSPNKSVCSMNSQSVSRSKFLSSYISLSNLILT